MNLVVTAVSALNNELYISTNKPFECSQIFSKWSWEFSNDNNPNNLDYSLTQQPHNTVWIKLTSWTAQGLKMPDVDDGCTTVLGVTSPLLSARLMPSAEWAESQQDAASSSCYLLRKHRWSHCDSEVYTEFTDSNISTRTEAPWRARQAINQRLQCSRWQIHASVFFHPSTDKKTFWFLDDLINCRDFFFLNFFKLFWQIWWDYKSSDLSVKCQRSQQTGWGR